MRTPITLKIKFKSSNLDQFIERYSVDVSRGGIFIRTKEPLPVGTQLRFEFQLQDASSLIAGDGTVVWIREHDPARQGVAPGMGVRFDKLAADSQKVLDRILSEKQKRGDAQLESRFDAGVRASASASGTLSSSGARVAGHNDFSGGDSRTATPLPGAIPGLAAPDDEFGNESTRVMQNELVQSLADRTRGQSHEDAANAFSEPEPTRKASVEELKLAVQDSAVDTEPKKQEPKVEVAPAVEAKKEEPKQEPPKPAVVEAKAEEPKPVVVEAKKEEPKPEPVVVEAKKEEKKPEPVAKDAKHKKGKQRGKHDEKRAEAKNGELKDGEAKKADDKSVQPAEKKNDKAATAAAYPKPGAGAPARKRSPLPLYAGVAVVALVGGYTVFRNKGADDDQAKPAQQQAAAQPEAAKPTEPAEPKVAQNETPKPTETPAAAEAKGDKPATAPTPAESPNPAKPEKEPTAVVEKPAGITVAVTSDPAGATVTLDGKPVDGTTPTTLSGLDAKKVYELKLALKGFHDWKVKLKPKAGDKIDAALVPNEKIVEVATTPPGADVVLDGKRVGKTPFTIHKLDLSKSHALEVKRAGFVAQSRSISATDTFEPKGGKDVLAVAMRLEAQPKAAAEKPAVTPVVAKPKPVVRKQPAVKKPTEEKPAEAASEKPAAEKPAASEKPAAAEKPAEAASEKPAAEKPAASEKPAGGIKVPSWMKQKPAESGGDKASTAGDTPAP
jgi:uncharacterized protein (TIGR02266 family)